MYKFKKILVLALVMLLAVSAPAFGARARDGIQTTNGISTSTALVLPAGTWVYGVKIYASAASSAIAVYDAATYVGSTIADAIDEVGEATQYESQVVWYPKPIYCANGVSAYILAGVGYIYYGPPPSK